MAEAITEQESLEKGTSRREFIINTLRYLGAGAILVSAPSLVESAQQSTSLDDKVDSFIKKLRKERKIQDDEKTAWSVYDFTANQKLVAINEELSLQSASMVKPLIALAFFHEVKQGRLSYDNRSKGMLRASIRASDNKATNWLIDRIGGHQRVQKILKENYGSILKNTYIVERIPPAGNTYNNKSSARDYSRFLYALWHNQLPYSKELKGLLSLTKRNRIYTGTKVPKGTLVIDKTGSTGRLCGDMGMLIVKDKRGNQYPYTLIGIIQKDSKAEDYTAWIRARGNVIRQVSNIVYDYMKVRHKL